MLSRQAPTSIRFCKCQYQWRPLRKRTFSSTPISPPSQVSRASVLGATSSELDRLGPRIDIQADQIKIIKGPSEFYEALKSKIRGAKRRIYLSTLYIGKSEHELVSCIREALQKSQDLEVSILTDALRGTREDPEPSCASLLAALKREFPSQVEIRMYHTPNLTGIRKKLIPKRINEGWGLQHMKLYGIDDEVILSGANLSSDYFTNRQDRYHVFSSKPVTDFFARVHHTSCSVSFLLRAETPTSHILSWPSTNPAPSPLTSPAAHTRSIASLFQPLLASSPAPNPSQSNTSLYPVLSLPPSINTELPALRSLLSSTHLPSQTSYLFTAGYFNPHPLVTASLLSSPFHGTILTASPWANGFYNSNGISGMLPAAYTLLSRRFLVAVRRSRASITFHEWRRGTVGEQDGWTYHAKGLWITLPTDAKESIPGDSALANPNSTSPGPSITLIGSSNYTKRSYGLDTEVGAVMMTTDEGLMQELKTEEQALMKYSKEVGEGDLQTGERRVGLGVRIALWIVGIVGGAL